MPTDHAAAPENLEIPDTTAPRTPGSGRRLITHLFQEEILPEPQLEEMFTVPSTIEGADMSAGLQLFEYGGKVYWLKSGARYGHSAVVVATRDLSRTLVHSANSTHAKGELKPVARRIASAALK
ncbi:hypothetical protein [Streptomyces sp. NPDC048641]|uniref:hypothetical protein n=1 Tax=unclassified Streptomyces TaxID=2593676 RepID=UPI003424C3D1